jgi:hypothetical protein
VVTGGVGDDWSVQTRHQNKIDASLFASSAIVWVGPPLFANPARSRFSVVLLLMLVPVKPQVPSSEML